MSDNGRLSVVFLFNLLLYFIIGEINHLLAGWSLHLHLDVLLLIFFGLHLNRLSGVVFTVLLGLLADAAHPVPTGTFVLGYLGIWYAFVWFQHRIRRQNPGHVRVVALSIQVLWMLVLAIFLGDGFLASTVYWQRILMDLILSGVVLLAVVWPWCAFQKKLLLSLGWNLDARMSGP